MRLERLDRQLRIEGWNQTLLEEAQIGVVGDDDLLVSMFVMSSAALGLNNMVVIAPRLNPPLIKTAQRLNPDLNLIYLTGFYTHPVLDDLFAGCHLMVDLCQYGLANKLLLDQGFREHRPIIRGFLYEQHDTQGLKVFTYLRGREWQELEQLVAPANLPTPHFDDAVLDLIVSGIVLEETKNVLMGRKVSAAVITYQRPKLAASQHNPPICVVGAGALGNFVGLGLASSGFRHLTFMDPDVVEMTNLNRQVLLYDAIGLNKAEALAAKLNMLFGTNAQSRGIYFRGDTDLAPYEVIFDCVDNFETRLALSDKCEAQNKILISGGTTVDAGQVVVYDPKQTSRTPAALLGLPDIVAQRRLDIYPPSRASCLYQPDTAVIMTNQIIAGFMVDAYRRLLDGQGITNIFYYSNSDTRI